MKIKEDNRWKATTQTSNICRSMVQLILPKWKEYCIAVNLPQQDWPLKLKGQGRRRLIGEAAWRHTVELEEIHSSGGKSGWLDSY